MNKKKNLIGIIALSAIIGSVYTIRTFLNPLIVKEYSPPIIKLKDGSFKREIYKEYNDKRAILTIEERKGFSYSQKKYISTNGNEVDFIVFTTRISPLKAYNNERWPYESVEIKRGSPIPILLPDPFTNADISFKEAREKAK